MKYKKVTVRLMPNNEIAAALLMDEMGEAGFESFVETEVGFEGYIQEELWRDGEQENTMAAVSSEVIGSKVVWTVEDAPDEDWNAEWEKTGFTPIYVCDGRCVIHGPEETGKLGTEMDVIIDPKNAFGSGHHETTRMIVTWLMNTNMDGMRVMDMGCGTGVLGIVAALRGAAKVDASDIDEWSVDNTRENAQLNGMEEKVTARKGGAETVADKEETYDLFIANIFREILTRDMHLYAAAIKRGGRLVVSGFLKEDVDAIKLAGEKNGLKSEHVESDGDWRMVVMRK